MIYSHLCYVYTVHYYLSPIRYPLVLVFCKKKRKKNGIALFFAKKGEKPYLLFNEKILRKYARNNYA